MNVKAKLTTYDESYAEFIEVESHWNRNGANGLVNIVIDGHKYTVASADLKKAIESCTGL